MCGIIGCINPDFDSASVLHSLDHRGPDSHGEILLEQASKAIWLAHTRLSILDLSEAGHQPMQSQDKRWWITYNGEVYNHLELRKSLNVNFKGHSDTETIVELIAQCGFEKAVSKLNGMFAFAALDTKEDKLYLVRDPFGIKPLYFSRTGRSDFSFASESKTLQLMNQKRSAVDASSLQTFLTLRYVPSPVTLWQNIYRLQPGHILTFDINTSMESTRRYIQPTTEKFSGSLNDAVENYHELLGQAVKSQMLSDVPVGILLSGGIDSALVASMARSSVNKLAGFTVGFGSEHPECEISAAQETADVLDMDFESIIVTPENLQNAFEQIVSSVEEPLGTTSVLPMWYLVQQARKNVTVVLTGQGNDEPWGGYRRYQVEMLRAILPFPILLKYFQFLPKVWKGMPEVIERGLRTLPVNECAERFSQAYALFTEQERLGLTGNGDSGASLQNISYWLDWLSENKISTMEQMMRVDTRMNLADDLLLYGDKMSMAVSLEARVPMLDHDVIRFVESLPLSYRSTFRHTKIVHKKMAEKYLPFAIVHRKKKGFQVPFGEWSRGIWRDWVESWLLDSSSPYLNTINKVYVEKLWHEHLNMKPDRSRQIFSLLMLAIWWSQQEQSI